MSKLGTEGAFEVLAKARRLEAQGKKIVHLEIGAEGVATPDNIVEAGITAMQNGDADFATAANIVEAVISAMQNGSTHYTQACGIFDFGDAVAGLLSRTLKT